MSKEIPYNGFRRTGGRFEIYLRGVLVAHGSSSVTWLEAVDWLDDYICQTYGERDARRLDNPRYISKLKGAVAHANFQARKHQVSGVLTYGDWRAVIEHFGLQCLSCGEVIIPIMDHIHPLSTGGSNTIDNIQPLCIKCNTQKSNRLIDYRPAERLEAFLATLAH